jgi:hypothetical protein
MAYLAQREVPPPTERMDYYPPNYPIDKYGYGVHEGEYSTEPAGDIYNPNWRKPEVQMTPQQIEAAVKREQPAQSGGLALAAIAAYLILGA